MTMSEGSAAVEFTGKNLCFVLGAPRSGTTWVQRLIASHPMVHTGQESYLFYWYLGPQLKKWKDDLAITEDMRGGIGLKCYLQDEEFRRDLKSYALMLMRPMVGDLKEGEIFLEKTPLHAFNIPEILELFPKSKIIHVLRDAREAVASMVTASRSWAKVRLGEMSAPQASKLWVSHVREVIRARHLIPDDQFLEIRYEQLLSAPERILGEAWAFLGLKYDQGMVEDAVRRNDASVVESKGTKIPLGGEAAKGGSGYVVEPSGFVGASRSSGWKSDLSLIQKFQVWTATRKMMQTVGYKEGFPLWGD
jgi:hypothetical protein